MMRRASLAVIGAGPAGLSAALAASSFGVETTLIDDSDRPGGQLTKQTHKFFGDRSQYCGTRGMDIATILARDLDKNGVRILTGTSVVGLYRHPRTAARHSHFDTRHSYFAWTLGLADREKFRKLRAESLIIATGAQENNLLFPGNDLPGVYGAGAVQTLMNVFGVKPGSRVLMVGSGNIGLIVSYQLIQAGIDVAAVVEVLPAVGGYHVHAAKLARLGVPILTSHTLLRAQGTECVSGAVISKVNAKFKPVPGTEAQLKVDAICLAVGLTPLAELLRQAGCRMAYVPELGGQVAWHDETMQTSVPGIYVAGDVSGIEEASTAMLEGRIAGAHAALRLGGAREQADQAVEQAQTQLCAIRSGSFSSKIVCGKDKLAALTGGTTGA